MELLVSCHTICRRDLCNGWKKQVVSISLSTSVTKLGLLLKDSMDYPDCKGYHRIQANERERNRECMTTKNTLLSSCLEFCLSLEGL